MRCLITILTSVIVTLSTVFAGGANATIKPPSTPDTATVRAVVPGPFIGPLDELFVSNRAYCVRDDDFGTTTTIRNDGSQGFTVTVSSANSPRVVAYPNIFRGWQWGIGTGGRWPVRVSQAGTPRVNAWYTTNTWRGAYDDGLDLWFSRYAQTNGQVTGTEIMVWLAHPGVGAGGPVVILDGIAWTRMEWTTVHSDGTHWPLVIYAAVRQRSSVKNLWLNPFFRDAEQHGWLKGSYYWTGIDAGFELWHGGKGLAVNYFDVTS